MQQEASEYSGKLWIFHVQLCLFTVVSHLVPFPTEYSTRFVALSYGALRSLTVLIPSYCVCQDMLRLSQRVEFKDIK